VSLSSGWGRIFGETRKRMPGESNHTENSMGMMLGGRCFYGKNPGAGKVLQVQIITREKFIESEMKSLKI